MRTIENVETIGISPDEIRIISKEETATFNRNMKISLTDAERVTADVQSKEVVIQLKESVHCDIYGYEILCGAYIGRKY